MKITHSFNKIKINNIPIIQTELEFSKVFIEYIKSIQYHKSQRANSIFTNEVFAIIYSYISILEKTAVQSISPTETSNITISTNYLIIQTIYHLKKMIITNQIFLHHTLKNIAHEDHDKLNHPKI